jgi:hypothetical protein
MDGENRAIHAHYCDQFSMPEPYDRTAKFLLTLYFYRAANA